MGQQFSWDSKTINHLTSDYVKCQEMTARSAQHTHPLIAWLLLPFILSAQTLACSSEVFPGCLTSVKCHDYYNTGTICNKASHQRTSPAPSAHSQSRMGEAEPWGWLLALRNRQASSFFLRFTKTSFCSMDCHGKNSAGTLARTARSSWLLGQRRGQQPCTRLANTG